MQKNWLVSGALLALLSPCAPAIAQTANPATYHLMKSYGINAAEAESRISIQGEILALSDRLNSENDEAYADMYIQHEPVYKIIVSFADKKDRKSFLDALDPKLRRYVQLKNAKKPRGVAARELDELNAAVAALNVPFTSVYDLPTEQFVITAENAADVAKINAALPATRKVETTVRVGLVPKIEAAPTGVVAGDRLSGGNPVWTATGGTGGYCSFGFGVTYTSGTTTKKGILTAGHCPSTMYARIGTHDVTLSGPIAKKAHKTCGPAGCDGISDKYDYQIWDATGLTIDNQISYVDKNSIPEFPASGTFRMTSITTFLNQKAGMIVCKSGYTTGITCGEITNGNASRDGVAGWIEVSKSQQTDISQGGDSGGPWFLYPGSSTNVVGLGVHTAGAGKGTTGIAQYMPIDYIDDHVTSVNTIKN
jgi:hypothetical protein